MASAQTVMAQSDKKALHPFFRRYGGEPVTDFPPSLNLQSNKPSQKDMPESGSIDSIDPATWKSGDRKTGRKKRRKITVSSQNPGYDSAVSTPSETEATLAANDTTPTPTDATGATPTGSTRPRYSLRGSDSYIGPIKSEVEISPLAECSKPGQEKPILQLNSKGTLLESPVHNDTTDCPESREEKKRGRPRKKKDPEVERQSKIAIMKYGAGVISRRYIGSAISDIMSGRTTFALAAHAEQPKLLQEPSKPTHPFFLGKPPKIEDIQQQPMPESQEKIGLLSNEPGKFGSIHSEYTRPRSTLPLKKPMEKRNPNNPIEPLWPPLGMCRIDNSQLEDQIIPNWRLYFSNKKSKGPPAAISKSDSILKSLCSQVRKCNRKPSKKSPLRQPDGRQTSGILLKHDMLQNIGGDSERKAAWEASRSGKDDPWAYDSKINHPAVRSLLDSIVTSRGTFQKGGYDELPWTQKYAPDTTSKVLQAGLEAQILHDWLRKLTVSSIDTGENKITPKIPKTQKKDPGKKKKRKRAKDLDDFIISSNDDDSCIENLDDEDELAGPATILDKSSERAGSSLPSIEGIEKPLISNTILLSGPSGCGKTAAVYAVAKDLGFEVFEVNPGSRRSAKDLIERVGDMTQNHLVQISKNSGNHNPTSSSNDPSVTSKDGQQASMNSFFKQKPFSISKRVAPNSFESSVTKSATSQQQSLILLEEVDILFSEDKQFWNGVTTLISQSKRPIILTCNNERLLPMENLSLHTVLHFCSPPPELAVDYVSALCANESHLIDRDALVNLYTSCGHDLRSFITQLNYWCQWAVGSKKAGLDWIIGRPWAKNPHDPSRDVSQFTFVRSMDLMCRDIVVGHGRSIGKRIQLLTTLLRHHALSMMDWLQLKKAQKGRSCGNGLLGLDRMIFLSDMESSLDILNQGSESEPTQDLLDDSFPRTSEQQRLDSLEGYQYLQADRLPDHAALTSKLCATIAVLMYDSAVPCRQELVDQEVADYVREQHILQNRKSMSSLAFENVFRPLLENSDASASGLRPLSFEHGTSVISEEVAPYIRCIAMSELWLGQQRAHFEAMTSQDGSRPKRARTTRASRAALEGGDKATARRGRWFPAKLPLREVLATGAPGWESACLRHMENVEKLKRKRLSVEDLLNDSSG